MFGEITVHSRAWTRRHKREFDAVLTIEDPNQRNGVRFHRSPRPDHLVLRFADLDKPAPGPAANWPVLRMPTDEDLRSALEFARRHVNGRLLVHCNVGVARSTAVALAILVDRVGPGREVDCLKKLLELRPIAVPNLYAVKLADDVLGCDGRLLDVVITWDQGLAANLRRRVMNRYLYLTYYNAPLDVPVVGKTPIPPNDLKEWLAAKE